MNKRDDILNKKADIEYWIKNNKSKAYICMQLKCKQSTLNKYMKIMDIDYKGNQSGKGSSKHTPTYIPLKEYLVSSDSIQSNKIRTKLLREGYKKHQCESCGLKEWLGKPIPLELHHIDGNHFNNTIENFQLLCPNCHAFTDSYRGKNKNVDVSE